MSKLYFATDRRLYYVENDVYDMPDAAEKGLCFYDRTTAPAYKDADCIQFAEPDEFAAAFCRACNIPLPEGDRPLCALIEDETVPMLPVYKLDHSGVMYSTTPFNDAWDSGLVGCITPLFDDDTTPDDMRAAYITHALTYLDAWKQQAAHYIEQYNAVLQGDAYSVYEVDDPCYINVGPAINCDEIVTVITNNEKLIDGNDVLPQIRELTHDEFTYELATRRLTDDQLALLAQIKSDLVAMHIDFNDALTIIKHC